MQFNIEKLKKHKVLIGSLTLAMVLTLLIGIGLYSSYKKYLIQKNELKQMLETYEQLIRRQPYPNEKNMAILSSNIIKMAHQFNALNDELRSGELHTKQISNTDFMRLLEHKLSVLRSTMERKGIKLPDKYAFGFEKYAGGQLPAPEEVPRLMQQLFMTETICLLLTESNIKELSSINRETFEGTTEITPIKRGRGGKEPATTQSSEEQTVKRLSHTTSLYTNEPFKISFRCSEGSLLVFLNKLAVIPTFVRIKSLEVQNTKKDFNMQNVPLQKTDATSSNANVYVSRNIIIGREDLEVKMDIDIYSFAPSLEEAEIMRMIGKIPKK